MMRAVSNFGAGYKPPTYHALRGPLLQATKAKIDRKLDVWRSEGKRVTGFVISSDGWEDTTGKPLINILLSTPKGAHFVQAVNTSGETAYLLCHACLLTDSRHVNLLPVNAGHTKDAPYIAELWLAQIRELGAAHCSLLITDGASVNPAAGKIVTAE